MAERFSERIGRVRDDLQRMGNEVLARLRRTLRALERRDTKVARETIEADTRTDEQEVAIEQACIDLLAEAKRGPAEARRVTAVVKVNSDLERIGDLAVNIAEQPDRLEYAMHDLMISEMIERIADLCTNIAEDAIFMVTGRIVRHGRKA